jgi:hypothetical protein
MIERKVSRGAVEGYGLMKQNVEVASWDFEEQKGQPAYRLCEKRDTL